jgi:antiviral helicase SKI2
MLSIALEEKDEMRSAEMIEMSMRALLDDDASTASAPLLRTPPGFAKDSGLTSEHIESTLSNGRVQAQALDEEKVEAPTNPKGFLDKYADLAKDKGQLDQMRREREEAEWYSQKGNKWDTEQAGGAEGGGGGGGGGGSSGGAPQSVAFSNLFDDGEDDDDLLSEESDEEESEDDEEDDDDDEEDEEVEDESDDVQEAVSVAEVAGAAPVVELLSMEVLEEELVSLLDEVDVQGATTLKGTSSSELAQMSEHMMKKRQQKQHQWAVTKATDVSDFRSLVPDMALEYPFELDTFQKQAVYHLEHNDCVFVAAHTSAGKTVVAEYAIAMAQKHMTRTIYTSPIKALSNQKYRDFKTRFGDVGLLTGDVSINPEASCLIMTTEILRSMLYRGADLVRDIEWVVFDEVHYVNDSERGVVWEEVIIMLPQHVNMIFLSATTPNTVEFSNWIGRTKRKKVYVMQTDKRPVPLQHYLYNDGTLHKVMDHYGNFLMSGHKAAMSKTREKEKEQLELAKKGKGRGGRGRGGKGGRGRGNQKQDRNEWIQLLTSLKEKQLLPVVVFAFSKKKCAECAYGLTTMDFNTQSEKSEVHIFLQQSISRLQGSDKRLPQVLAVGELLKRGIGVHHGGLLPILKEMVEILFGRGLVKVLFATETFAMGVNMPARTVVFNGIRKHDGRDFRNLQPGEYTQMAGRAGRRGLDPVGTVIQACWNEVPEMGELHTLLKGQSTKLESQFRLTYTMILNLLRVEDMSVEDMIKRSFSEFHTQQALDAKRGSMDLPQLLQQYEKQLTKIEVAPCFCIGGPCEIEEYYNQCWQITENSKWINQWIMESPQASKMLSPGRVLLVNIPKGTDKTATAAAPGSGGALQPVAIPEALAVVLSGGSTGAGGGGRGTQHYASQDALQRELVVAVLYPAGVSVMETAAGAAIKAAPPAAVTRAPSAEDRFANPFGRKEPSSAPVPSVSVSKHGQVMGRHYQIVQLPVTSIVTISKQKLKSLDSTAILEQASSAALSKVVQEMLKVEEESTSATAGKGGADGKGYVHVEAVDPIKDLKMNDFEFQKTWRQNQDLVAARAQSSCHACPKLTERYATVMRKSTLEGRVTKLQKLLSNESLALFPDFQKRVEVLATLGYIDAEDTTVQLKGRVACEVNTCESLILTEMIFENVLAALEPEEIAAVLSSLIFQQKTQVFGMACLRFVLSRRPLVFW